METFSSFKSAEIAKKLQKEEENRTNKQTLYIRSFVDFRKQTNCTKFHKLIPWHIGHVDVPELHGTLICVSNPALQSKDRRERQTKQG